MNILFILIISDKVCSRKARNKGRYLRLLGLEGKREERGKKSFYSESEHTGQFIRNSLTQRETPRVAQIR